MSRRTRAEAERDLVGRCLLALGVAAAAYGVDCLARLLASVADLLEHAGP